MDQTLYQLVLRSLLYLLSQDQTSTSAVSNVAKFGAKTTKQHLVAVKYVLRYLQGTQKDEIFYSRSVL